MLKTPWITINQPTLLDRMAIEKTARKTDMPQASRKNNKYKND